MTGDGTLAYVSNQLSNTVGVIDTANRVLLGTSFAVGEGPAGIAVTPDGSSVYVANSGERSVSAINTVSSEVKSIAIEGSPQMVAMAPDGKFAYVTSDTGETPGSVSIIEVTSNTVPEPAIPVGVGPQGIAIVEVP
jgi:YVTN family beta-propeller protein